MSHESMRALLEEGRQELGVLFEHGLAQGGMQEQAFRELEARMEESGLAKGAALAQGLAGELAASRLDAAWKPEAAAALYADLWRYLGLCLRRLEFLEAKARIAAQAREPAPPPDPH